MHGSGICIHVFTVFSRAPNLEMFQNKRVCIVGELQSLSKTEVKHLVKKHGGKYKKKLSEKIDIALLGAHVDKRTMKTILTNSNFALVFSKKKFTKYFEKLIFGTKIYL